MQDGDNGIPAGGTLTNTDSATPPPKAGTVTDDTGVETTQQRGCQLPLVSVPPDFYSMEQEVGRGGVGVVTRAHDRRLGRSVALKRLQRPEPQARLRFEREMRITAKLQHPGVVPIHEAGVLATGEPFYAMKLVEGRSLKELIGDCKSLDERLQFLPNLLAVVETIAYAHSKGTIHRDLKPSNIIVGAYGETVVIDWGLAKDLNEPDDRDVPTSAYRGMGAPAMTMTGQVVGTPAYMPPEQARGEAADERADVYALGAVLRQVITGSPPYSGGSSQDVLRKVLSEDPPKVRSVVPSAPADLSAIVEKAMSRGRASRYPCAQELASELRAFLGGRFVGAYRYAAAERARKWFLRHRGIAYTAAVSLACVAILGIVGILRLGAERNRALASQQEAVAARQAQEKKAAQVLLEQAERELEAGSSSRALRLLAEYPEDGNDWERLVQLVKRASIGGIPNAWLGSATNVAQINFDETGRYLAIARDDALLVWDTQGKNSPARHIKTPDIANHQVIDLGPVAIDNRLYWAITTFEGLLTIVPHDDTGPAPRTTQLYPCAGEIYDAEVSTRSAMAVIACYDGPVVAVSLATGAHRIVARHSARPSQMAIVAVAAADVAISVGLDGRVLVMDVAHPNVASAGDTSMPRHHALQLGVQLAAVEAVTGCDEALIGARDGRLHAMSLGTKQVRLLDHGALPVARRIELSSDCRHAAIHDEADREVFLLDLPRGNVSLRFTGTDGHFSEDGATYWIGHDDGSVESIDLETGWRERFRGSGPVRFLRISADGQLAVVGSDISLWPSIQSAHILPLGSQVKTLGTNATDTSLIIGTYDGSILEVSFPIVALQRLPSPHTSHVIVRFGGADVFFTAGLADGCVYRWSENRYPEFAFCVEGGVFDIAPNSAGTSVYVISSLGKVVGYDHNTGTQHFAILPEHDLARIAYDPFDHRILVGTNRGSVYVLDLSLTVLSKHRLGNSGITHVAGGPDGSLFAVQASGVLSEWFGSETPRARASCGGTAFRGWTRQNPFLVAVPCQNGQVRTWPQMPEADAWLSNADGLSDIDGGSLQDIVASGSHGGAIIVADHGRSEVTILAANGPGFHNIEVLPATKSMAAGVRGYAGLAIWQLSSDLTIPTNSHELHKWLVSKHRESN